MELGIFHIEPLYLSAYRALDGPYFLLKCRDYGIVIFNFHNKQF